jgi:Carboxypeptidase regulatory-like domain
MKKRFAVRLFATCGVAALALGTGGAARVAPTPVGTATIKGVVKVQGAVPKPTHIDMSQDPKCAQMHPNGGATEDIVADANGDLANVIVYVSQGLGDSKFDPPAQPATIDQKGCMYMPHIVAVRANQELKVVNSDPTTHNIHPSPNNNRELNQSQPPGTPFSMTFAREEIAIPVKCNIHPWMHSYIAVFQHPFFAVSGKDGSFEIANLPPGSYTITAWHEKLGTAFQKITVGDGERKTLDFAFKSQAGS